MNFSDLCNNSTRDEEVNAQRKQRDACHDIDRLVERVTPSHSTHLNLLHIISLLRLHSRLLQTRSREFIGLNGKFLRFRRDGPFLKQKWIFYDNVIRKRQWFSPGEAPKPTPKKNVHSKKLMNCVWWDMEGIYTRSYDPTKP
jgi:hypothetical protein